MSDTTPTTPAVTPATSTPTAPSFFSSSVFHNHVRTWVFVILSIALVGFLYVHESNAIAAANAQAAEVIKQAPRHKPTSISKSLRYMKTPKLRCSRYKRRYSKLKQ
jgi:hypothetical protein